MLPSECRLLVFQISLIPCKNLLIAHVQIKPKFALSSGNFVCLKNIFGNDPKCVASLKKVFFGVFRKAVFGISMENFGKCRKVFGKASLKIEILRKSSGRFEKSAENRRFRKLVFFPVIVIVNTDILSSSPL